MESRTLAGRGCATLLILAGGVGTWGLARVDTDVGPPTGPDRQSRPIGPSESAAETTSRAYAILRSRPLDGAAFRLLGGVAEAAGNRDAAERFYRIALARVPRDAVARAKLIEAAFRGGRLDEALKQLDVLLRVAPEAGQPLLQRLVPLLGNRPLRAALVDRLQNDPPWRPLLPGVLSASRDAAPAEALLGELASVSALHPPEIALRVSLLERLGRPLDARNVWRAALPPSLRPLDGLVFDGGFESGEGPEPFGWRLRGSPEVAVGVDSTQPAQGRQSLALLFDGRAITTTGVTQDIVLGPGPYRLELRGKVDGVANPELFAWTITCPGSGRAIASLPLHATGLAWQAFGTDFEVPAGCPAQQLALVHTGRSLEQRQVSGRLDFDALDIRPAGH